MSDDILSGKVDDFTFTKLRAVGMTLVQYGTLWAELSHSPVFGEVSENMKLLYRNMMEGANNKLKMVSFTKNSIGACYDFLFYMADQVPNMVELDNHLRRHGISMTYETPYGQECSFADAMRLLLTQAE